MTTFDPKRNKDDRRIFSFCLSMMRKGIPSGLLCKLNLLAREVLAVDSNKTRLKLCGRSSFAKRRRADSLAVCSFCYRINCVGDYKCMRARFGAGERIERGKWIRHGMSSSLVENETPVCAPLLKMHILSEFERVKSS
ncbi:putative nucleic acid-binding protein [Peach mosaic virus]|uniref:RNA silencing suppressor n=1 Tax=Peach mosaic virus TaxID=183585 RepID=Q1PSJ9_9VIRU|nr:putative nucleic acid-binding protein [Peach mosaic virus]ABA18639.1 putative nucleic acid-binding protein [Peach mosaic virus]